jgi:hypothetical protein
MGFLSSLFGVSDRTPKTTQVVQTSKLPEELAPFVTDVLGEAQEMYKAETERGYDPYTGETIAGFTPQEEQALKGLEGLVGTTKPYLDEAVETYRKGGDQFTAEVAQQYMSPYQQAVTDIEKRKAQENFEANVMPAFEAQAISQGGGPGGLGTRAGIQAAELQRGQSQLLADIEAQGLQRAYADARTGFEAQKKREQTMADSIARAGTGILAGGIQEQGALQAAGEQRRGMGQAVLDEAYGKFLEEKNFPKQTLSDYSSTIYGAAPSFKSGVGARTTTEMRGAPSMGQQLLGLGMAGLNSFTSGTLGNIFQRKAEGGPVIEAQTGLSIEDQIKNLTKQQGYFNPRGARLSRGTAAAKRRADIQRSKNFLRGIQQEDEAKIKKAMENQFKNFPPDEARKLAIDTIKPYSPSQVQGGRGNINPSQGLAGINLGNMQGTKTTRTLEELNQPITPKAPSIYNQTTGTGGQSTGIGGQSAEQKQINNTINTLTGMLPVKYSRQPGQPVAGDTTNLKRIGDLGSGQAFTLQQPDVDALIKSKEQSIRETDPRFDVDAQRKRKSGALNNMLTTLRSNLNKKVKIQEEGYTQDDEALETFLDESEKSIREDGATTSDIMADAIDQGMNEPTIVTMLTKVLNVNEKGVQKRAREVNKELRDLNKQKFIMEKESRKEKRTDKLANAEKDSEIALKKIAGQLKIEEDLEKLPSELKKQAMAELTAISTLKTNDLNRSLEVYKVIAKYKQLAIQARKNEIDAAGDSTTSVKGSDYNSLLKFFDTIIQGISDPAVGIVGGKPIGKEARRRNAKINQIGAQILAGNMIDPYSGKTGAAAARSYIENELKNLRPIN